MVSFTNMLARLRDERGGVVVLFALLVPTLLLAFAIATDVGNWFVHRRHLQMQVDAAALAGGSLFGNCFSTDPNMVAAANTAIENEAAKYAGLSSSAYTFRSAAAAATSPSHTTARPIQEVAAAVPLRTTRRRTPRARRRT
jgi:uncharacterized membrane protein